MELWIAGQFIAETDKGVVWEFQGVFSTEQGARAACASDLYFIAPATVGNLLPRGTADWPGLFYPLRQEGPAV